jgi:TPP-dependent pyruvate/acetoin dehydrogenase alpha subunit
MLSIREARGSEQPGANAGELTCEDFSRLARSAPDRLKSAVGDEFVRTAIRMREVENALLGLFSRGLMNGTFHTCVGQEMAAVAVAGQLTDSDWVASNHRCHGHFIAKTDIGVSPVGFQ